MAILVGFHVEGWDHLILRSFLAAILGLPEGEIIPDWIDQPGRGWTFVLQNVHQALRRFYAQCAQLAIVGIDNDGNADLVRSGAQEDPLRPRHWNHTESLAQCRYCQLMRTVSETRLSLPALPAKPPQTWPVIVAVPVEMVEAWVLELQSIVDPTRGTAQAERSLRSGFKMKLYGQPAASKLAVQRIALPLIRSATPTQLAELRRRSLSFDSFAKQVDESRAKILGPTDCWKSGDGGAERPRPDE